MKSISRENPHHVNDIDDNNNYLVSNFNGNKHRFMP